MTLVVLRGERFPRVSTSECAYVVGFTVFFLHSWAGWLSFYRGGFVRIRTTPLTPGCHCAPVTINHILQSLALLEREGTNHTPHYPGLVTLERCRPGTPQPVAVWPEPGRWREWENLGVKNAGSAAVFVGRRQRNWGIEGSHFKKCAAWAGNWKRSQNFWRQTKHPPFPGPSLILDKQLGSASP